MVFITSIFKQAGEHLSSSKGPLWAIIIPMSLLTLLLRWVFLWVAPEPLFVKQLWEYVGPALQAALLSPFLLGALMVAVRRMRGDSINWKTGFSYFRYSGRVICLMMLVGLILGLPLYVSVLLTDGGSVPFILVASLVAIIISVVMYAFLLFSIPLLVDRQLTVTQAFAHSVSIVKPHALKVIAVFILNDFCLLAALLPFIISWIFNNYAVMFFGLLVTALVFIWMVPYVLLVLGGLYNRLVTHSDAP
jgi:hypothetical protein